MAFLRRLFGRNDGGEVPPEPSGSPAGPIRVDDPEATLGDSVGQLLARPELEFLIVEWDAARRLYLRLTPSAGGALLAECVGDRQLEPRHRLSEQQRGGLIALGWRETGAGGSWERTWASGAEPVDVARVCVETMRTYGLPARAEWTITFGAD
jgi:hypothetical protein